MVKVPIGKHVIVDLWDPVKRKGIVKYITDTLDLVQAESDFELNKGDRAIVIQSQDSFVTIIPDNEYSQLMTENGKDINYKGFLLLIYKQLKNSVQINGGIISLEEIYSDFMKTPLKYRLTMEIFKKIKKDKHTPFEIIEESGYVYFGLPVKELNEDIQTLSNYAKNHDFVTNDMIQTDTNWSVLRIERLLKFFVQTNRTRQDYSFKGGVRYYFIGL